MFPLQPAAWLEHCGFFYFCHSMLIKLILAFKKFPPACASVCLRETGGEEVVLMQVSERKELQASQLLGEPEVLPKYPSVTACYDS